MGVPWGDICPGESVSEKGKPKEALAALKFQKRLGRKKKSETKGPSGGAGGCQLKQRGEDQTLASARGGLGDEKGELGLRALKNRS